MQDNIVIPYFPWQVKSHVVMYCIHDVGLQVEESIHQRATKFQIHLDR